MTYDTDWRDIEGCFSFAAFYDWVAANRTSYAWHGVEVGALYGQSAAYLAEALRRYYMPSFTERLDVVEIDDNEAIIRGHMRRFTGIGQIHSPMSSVDASKLYADASLDLVYLDGDHSYDGVRSDIDAWLPKVRSGGILAGHDFAHYFPGLMRAVLESFPALNVWRGSEWPDENVVAGPRLDAAEKDFRTRSARGEPRDYLATWWVRI